MSEKRKRGNQTRYTKALASEICERMSRGETLTQICRDEHIPPKPTVLLWVKDDREGFADQYARAREALIEHWAEETLDISDNGANDWQDREYGAGRIERVVDSECVQRSKLRVDTRKWLLSKLKPHQYGDKVDVAHGGSINLTITADDERL